MWKPILGLSFVVLFCLMTHVGYAEGRECYSCLHVEGGSISNSDLEKINLGGIKGHKSCKSGKKPDKSYTTTCDNKGNSSTDSACVKVYYKGKISNQEYKVTLRGCFNSTVNLTETCQTRTLKDVADIAAPSSIQAALEWALTLVDANTTSGDFCTCKSDKCNTAPKTLHNGLALIVLTCLFTIVAPKLSNLIF